MKAFLLALTLSAILSTTAQARNYYRYTGHHLTHHYGRYLAYRHFRHTHTRTHYVRRYRQHRDAVGLARARLPDGQTITVAAPFVERFVGFFIDLFHEVGKLPEIYCYAPTGHMRNSLHHWGGACDVGQQSRNVAWKPMYHVTEIAHRWGLTDGCEWRGYPDCGHVEVNRKAAIVHRQPQLIKWASGAPL